MRRLLVVSPQFPPINAADSHRARMSLPYYREFGWQPYVLTVRADQQPEARDPSLVETLPPDVPITTAAAWPLQATRVVGIGNAALRAWWSLYRTGARLIREQRIDLVFFSTTMMFALPMGRLWRARLGVPYVIDLQDPWWTDYANNAAARPGAKARGADAAHRLLEGWTLRRASGVMTVSDGYTDTLRARYSSFKGIPVSTIPFGGSEHDAAIAAGPAGAAITAGAAVAAGATNTAGTAIAAEPTNAQPATEREYRGVYIGRGGPDMATAVRILCRALQQMKREDRKLEALRLEFLGTSYAADGRARPTIAPVAIEEGVGAHVVERTQRIPYLDALRRLHDAPFLCVVGSDDPAYSPSKIYPYILARRPIVAVLHEASAAVDVIRKTNAGLVVTFRDAADIDGPAAELARLWPRVLSRLDAPPSTDWSAFVPYTARVLTGRQCELFEAAMRPAS